MIEKEFLEKEISAIPLHTSFPLSTNEGMVDYGKLVKYLKSVEITSYERGFGDSPLSPIGGPPPADDEVMGQEKTYVCSGFVFHFDATIPHYRARIILMSNLLAQLVADQEYVRHSNEWWEKYHEFLGVQGWVMSSFIWEPVDVDTLCPDEKVVTIRQVLSHIAADIGVLGQNTCNEMCNKLLSNINSPEFAVIEYKSTVPGGAISLAPLIQYKDDGDGAKLLSVSMIASVYVVKMKHKAFLWWAWSKETTEYYRLSHSETLNYDAWKKVEESVEEKVQEFAPFLIGPLS